jgi:hypothetical protein
MPRATLGRGGQGAVGANAVGQDGMAIEVCHVGELARWIHGH